MKREMKRSKRMFAGSVSLLALAYLLPAALVGCKEYRSYWIYVTVVNQTGSAIRDIEVDYPSAGFGINLLAPDGVYHYRLKVNGHGKVFAQYIGPMDRTIRVAGPEVKDNEQGELTVTLLPGNKIEFAEHLSMGH